MNRHNFLVSVLALCVVANAIAEVPQVRSGVTPQSGTQKQWVKATGPNQQEGQPAAFPQAPQNPNAPAAASQPQQPQQQINTAFPPTTFNAASYAQGPSRPPQAEDGTAPLPPLTPPNGLSAAQKTVSVLAPQEIIKLRKSFDVSRKAKAYEPVKAIPRISSLTVDLSPGASLPILRTMPGEPSNLVFLDATGAPWPLAVAPRVSDARFFDVEWLEGSSAVVVSALSPYEAGNLTVFLDGLATPVVLKLATGEPDGQRGSRIVDYRLDLRVPGRGPNAKASIVGPGKIALYDEVMQSFLDGLPPGSARSAKVLNGARPRFQAWQLDGALYVRTDADLRSAFDQTMASADGTRVYKMALTPFVTLSDQGDQVTVELDIN